MANSETQNPPSSRREPAGPQGNHDTTYLDYFGLIGTDLLRLADVVWARRNIVLAITALALVGGVAWAIFAKPLYRAEVVTSLAPTQNTQNIGTAITSQLSGLSSLIGSAGKDEANQVVAALQTRSLLYPFIDQFNVKQTLFPNLWNPTTRSWEEMKPGMISGFGSAAIRYLNGRPDPPAQFGPTSHDAMMSFVKHLQVNQDLNAGLIIVQVDWFDPATAVTWANGLVATLNEQRRADAVARSNTRLKFLNAQLSTTTSVEMRDLLYRLIQGETQSIMMANSNPQFVLRVIDPAADAQQVWPMRGLIVMISGVIGLLAGFVVALAWSRVLHLLDALTPNQVKTRRDRKEPQAG